jgi:hypothetical protein
MAFGNTTELEAVNSMLATIGEAPVNTLDNSGLIDVAQARATLAEVSRKIQAGDWHFNREDNYILTPDYNGIIQVPFGVLKIDTVMESQDIDITVRGNKIYNRKDHTFVFEKALHVDMTVLLEWEDLPEPARQYIVARASREFQRRVVGSGTLDQFAADDELRLLISLQDFDGSTADYNILTSGFALGILWR